MPHTQPHQIAALTDVSEAPGFEPDAWRRPYLAWHEPPAGAPVGCLVLISGGAYENCCDIWLLNVWRDRFTKMGFQCVSLVYRTPRPKGLPFYATAWADGQRAIRLVRSRAAARGFDPEKIGTVSMSAGSHLATLLAVSSLTPAYARVDALDETPCHVNFAVTAALGYALTDGLGCPNAQQGDPSFARLDPVFRFDEKTAPMCLLHGGADIYSPIASTMVYRRLRQRGVPAEVHLFADYPHNCWGMNPGTPRSTAADEWCGRVEEFFRQLGVLPACAGPKRNVSARYASDAARASVETMPVWPEGKMPDARADQCLPELTWHIPTNLTTKAIQIVFSGGSYMANDPDGFEVAPVRRYLNGKGMAVVTLRYRTPRPEGRPKHLSAWQDLQRAIRVVRSEAAARGLDPARIGVMGSSAGGHLALMGATSSRRRASFPVDEIDSLSCAVQWAVAVYPAYALSDGVDAPNATGGNDLSVRLVPEFSFDPDTCPVLFVHGDADGWAAMNSVACWEQLRRMGIQGEVHTLAGQDHCFQANAAPGTAAYSFLDRIWEFFNAKRFNR
jgi:acetyl esterase/lipase